MVCVIADSGEYPVRLVPRQLKPLQDVADESFAVELEAQPFSGLTFVEAGDRVQNANNIMMKVGRLAEIAAAASSPSAITRLFWKSRVIVFRLSVPSLIR